jgi:cation transport ATPase
MSRHDQGNGGLSAATARRLEYAIIGLGVAALLLIFQPFEIALFTAGGVLVVVAALANNLLPLVQPGAPTRSVVKAAMIVAMTFCLVLLVSILAAYFYGLFFLKPPDPNTLTGKAQLSAAPWYMHGFTWTVAIIACVLAGALVLQSRLRTGTRKPSSEYRQSTSLGE